MDWKRINWQTWYFAALALISLYAFVSHDAWAADFAAMPLFSYFTLSVVAFAFFLMFLTVYTVANWMKEFTGRYSKDMRITLKERFIAGALGIAAGYILLGLSIGAMIITYGFGLEGATRMQIVSPLGMMFFLISLIQVVSGVRMGKESAVKSDAELSEKIGGVFKNWANRISAACLPGLLALCVLMFLMVPLTVFNRTYPAPRYVDAGSVLVGTFGYFAIFLVIFVYQLLSKRFSSWLGEIFAPILRFIAACVIVSFGVALFFFLETEGLKMSGGDSGQIMMFFFFITYSSIAIFFQIKARLWRIILGKLIPDLDLIESLALDAEKAFGQGELRTSDKLYARLIALLEQTMAKPPKCKEVREMLSLAYFNRAKVNLALGKKKESEADMEMHLKLAG